MAIFSVKQCILSHEPMVEVVVRGWVRTKRDGKNTAFLELNDGSDQRNLQIILDKSMNDWSSELLEMTTGSCISATGDLVASPGGKQSMELRAKEIKVYGGTTEDYPLQKKRHGFEFLREIAHLRSRTNTFGAITRVRNRLSKAVHDFFQERDFFWIHTPIITGSDAEGAGAMFQVTTQPLGEKYDPQKDFFGQPTHLTVSGQLAGEAYALSMGKIYTFGPTFRAENSNTTRHLAEFWMIEPEMAFYELEDNMALAQDFVQYLINSVLVDCPTEMEFFDKWIQKGLLNTLRGVCESDFKRISYTEAIDILKGAKHSFEYQVSWGIDLQSEHEKYLTDEHFGGPVIVTDYPKGIKAFYMKANQDGKTVRAMDVLVPRLGEIIGGSQREDDYQKLQIRMDELEIDSESYKWYLDLRRYGSAPHSGFGLGFERLVQYVTGMANIRDVIPFPRTVGSIRF